MIAVVPVRAGSLATGGMAAIAESGGVGIIIGEGAVETARAVAARAVATDAGAECRELRTLELGSFRPAEWAAAVAAQVRDHGPVVLPASPDGRDLAPRLAAELGWPLLAGAIRVTSEGASLAWRDGRQIAHFRTADAFVATLLPGSRNALIPDDAVEVPAGATVSVAGAAEPTGDGTGPEVVELAVEPEHTAGSPDADLVEVVEADPAVMDLSEASRIIGVGAGIGGPEHLSTVQVVAAVLQASVGATRVVTDEGWLAHDRQIGTTGVSVRPRCYLAFGISGAAQHVGGLGTPRYVVSVNTDGSCPMMAMADLAIVCDAREVLGALARRLSAVPARTSSPDAAGDGESRDPATEASTSEPVGA
jgi:electron transfer flavoprotein alpha subunit